MHDAPYLALHARVSPLCGTYGPEAGRQASVREPVRMRRTSPTPSVRAQSADEVEARFRSRGSFRHSQCSAGLLTRVGILILN